MLVDLTPKEVRRLKHQRRASAIRREYIRRQTEYRRTLRGCNRLHYLMKMSMSFNSRFDTAEGYNPPLKASRRQNLADMVNARRGFDLL